MSNTEPKYRRPLSIEQVEILELLYKFRFVAAATVKSYFAESNPGMNVFRRLETLESRGFIAKRYFQGYKLLHKPVAYYLLPEGARKLAAYREEEGTDKINITGIYRDGVIGEKFAMHCIAVFGLYNRLITHYGDDMDFFSKSDQAGFEDFPKPLPDAYITLQKGKGRMKYFFLDILDDDEHLFVDASRKIARYLNYRKSGTWATIDRRFPMVMFVCNSEAACQKVRRRCDTAANKAWVRDVEFVVTTSDETTLSHGKSR